MNPSINGAFDSFGTPGSVSGGAVLSGSYDVSSGAPVMVSSGGMKKRRWPIIAGVVVGAVVLAGIVVAILSLNKSPSAPISGAYYAYMSYLVKGEDSTEVFVEDDSVSSRDSAVQKAFDANDEEYFNKLQKLYSDFEFSFNKQPDDYKDRYSEVVTNYKELILFAVRLAKDGVFDAEALELALQNGEDLVAYERNRMKNLLKYYDDDEEDSYVWSRLEYAEVLQAGEITTESARELSGYANRIRNVENTAARILIFQGWNMQDMVETENEDEE